jgi:putative membrane protein
MICGGSLPAVVITRLMLVMLVVGYVVLAARQGRRGRRWSFWRTGSWVLGAALLAAGLSPDHPPFPRGDFRQHMAGHLAIGMFGPLALVMASPITLVLRSVPSSSGRVIVRLLKSRALRVLSHPLLALLLSGGGMALLYFTPLYEGMLTKPWLHDLVDFHFVAAGCLYASSIAGSDFPAHRSSVELRLVVLGLAIVAHSVVAQLLYANVGVPMYLPPHQLRQGAQLMYYGGDIAEILLAFRLVASWRPRQLRFTAVRTEVSRRGIGLG